MLLPILTAGAPVANRFGIPGGGKPPPAVWLGTFQPLDGHKLPACVGCAKAKIFPGPGEVVILASDRPAPTGQVLVVSPLLGVIWPGKIESGRVAVPWFNNDLRDGDDGVIVLPGDLAPRFVNPTPADILAIKQTLLRNDVLSHVKRSVDGTEVGAIDLDGNGVADLAVTYGCNMWGDGQCQGHGQFFLARRGAKWVEID
ncbi:MAG: hypothetical protein JWO36_1667 [Myxococcales bacterium]|nr:hypothetical protein [Myxococcales bacterium]